MDLWNIHLARKGKYFLFLINLAGSTRHLPRDWRGSVQGWWLLQPLFPRVLPVYHTPDMIC